METTLARRLNLLLLVGFALGGCSTDSSGGDKASAGAGGSSSAGQAQTVAGHASGGSPAGANAGGTTSKAGSAGTFTGGTSSAGGNAGCDTPGLTWKTARKTWYTSYPDPGSEECIKYNGCMWAGQFSSCDDKKPETWVSAHNIVAAFPDYDTLSLHDLCLKSGNKTIVVTVLDTCGDADCDGCCTQNKGDADELIDLESYTNDRFGIDDGEIQWADLGPTTGMGCD